MYAWKIRDLFGWIHLPSALRSLPAGVLNFCRNLLHVDHAELQGASCRGQRSFDRDGFSSDLLNQALRMLVPEAVDISDMVST
jgi:hypothetical protein